MVMVYFAILTVNGCCRASDNNNSVVQGYWYDPEGNEVGSYTDEHTVENNSFFAELGGHGEWNSTFIL